jgi:hypothetical protein
VSLRSLSVSEYYRGLSSKQPLSSRPDYPELLWRLA